MGTFRINLFNSVLCVHVFYMLLTAIWSLVNIDGFMVVTGPKTDIWLVKTVAVLLIVISMCMLLYLRTGGSELPVIFLGGVTALGFTVIDFYYSAHKVISPVYAYDGIIQVIFLGLWVLIFSRWLRDIY